MGYSNVTGDLNVVSTTITRDLNVRRDSSFVGNILVQGITTLQNAFVSNLTVTNTFTISATNTSFSNSLTVNNFGTTTALFVNQYEGGGPGHTHNVAEFWDYQTLAMCIDPEGNVAIHQGASPGYALTVQDGALVDNITVTGTYTGSGAGLTNVPVTGLYGALTLNQLQNTQTNITSVGTLWTLNVNQISNLNGSILGSLATPVQSNITTVGLLTNLAVSNSISVSNIVASGNLSVLFQTNLVSANVTTANVTTANLSTANISILNVNSAANIAYLSVSTLANSVSSNILTGNLNSSNTVTSNILNLNVSTGANTTYLTVSQLSNSVSSNILTANIQTANTQLANTVSLNVSGGANISYLNVFQQGNYYSSNLITANIQTENTVTSNILNLNVSTGANTTYLSVSQLANVASANLVTANITTENTVTANILNLNVSTGSNTTYLTVSQLANVSSANLVTANVQNLNVVSSNISILNVNSGANITQLSVTAQANLVSSNIGTANVQTGNVGSLNVTNLANIASANLVTGNVQTLNVVSSNISILNVNSGANITNLSVSTLSNISSANVVTANISTLNVVTMNLNSLNLTSTANLVTANIANIYTTNIVGFVGSQWTGTSGGPLYYATGNVAINTSTDFNSNLSVAGNIYATNAVSTTNLIATGTLTVSQGGTFNIPSVGQSAPQNFPETTATGYTLTTALGTYTISASSSNDPAWQAFDSSISSYWLSTAAAGVYSASSPYAYTGVYTTSTATNTYGGEWIQLQAPVKMSLTSVIVNCGPYQPTYTPGVYVILGNNSSGNTGWTLLATQTGFTTPQTTTIVGSANYNYIRIVFTNSQAGNINAFGYFALVNVTLTGTYLMPSSAPAIYSAGTVGIGTTTPSSNLQVQGNIYASTNISTPILNITSYANVTVLNVSSSANIVTANLITANIANIYTTNIVGFVGSQWSGSVGGPIYYNSGNVAIGSSTNSGANLAVTGNLFVSNAITTTNIFTTNLTATGTITGTWSGTNQGTLLTLGTNLATGTSFATSSDLPTLQAYHVPLQSFTQNALQAVSNYTITAQGLIKFSSTGLYQLTMVFAMDAPVVKVALGTNTTSAFPSSTSAYSYVYTMSSADSPSDTIVIPINVQNISNYYYIDIFCRSTTTSGTYYLTAGTSVTGSQNGTYVQINPFGTYISSAQNSSAGILLTTTGGTYSSPLAQASPLTSASNTYHITMTSGAGWSQSGSSSLVSVSANGNLQFLQAGVYNVTVCFNTTSPRVVMQVGIGSSTSDSSLPSTIGTYLYRYAPMYTSDPSPTLVLPLNVTDTTKFYYLDLTVDPSTSVTIQSTSTYVSVTPLSSYIPNPMTTASIVVSQVVTAQPTSYTASSSDYYIGMSNGGTVTLPQGATLTRGKTYTIKDESGLAGKTQSYNIIIQASGADVIDGQSNVYIQLAYTAVNVMWTGTNNRWVLI